MSKITAYGALTAPAANDELIIVDVSDTTMAASGTTKNITPSSLIPGVVYPSGVTGGTADPANVAAAISAHGCAVLMPGTYYGSSAVSIGVGQAVRGAGKEAVTWNNLSSGPAFTLANSGSYDPNTPAALTGLRIDGASSSGGASGFQAGDIVKLEIDVWVSNFTSGKTGAHFLNANWWTEQARARIYIENCDNGVKLDQSGSGTNSYDRCEFDLEFNQNASQNGIILAGSGTTGAVLIQGILRIHGNWTNSASSVTSSVISFTTSNAIIQSCRIEVGAEVDGAAAHSPQSVNFKDSSTVIQNCYGVIEFMNNGGTALFAASNNSSNFWFDGPVIGDTSLLSSVISAPNTVAVTSGFPTGWSGKVTLAMPRGDGMVFWQNELQVAGSTVMTAFETIVSAGSLPSWAIPANSRYCTADINGTYCSFIMSNLGIRFVGPAQTPGSTIFPYGQTWYRNS